MLRSVAQSEEGRLTSDCVEGVLGHAVVVTGVDEGNEPSIAVWTASPLGTPTGAWVYGYAVAMSNPHLAAQLVGLTSGRAIVCWDTDQSMELLCQLEKTAGMPRSDWRPRILRFIEILTRIQDYRENLSRAVLEHAAKSKSKLVSLDWRRAIPVAAGNTMELTSVGGVRRPSSNSEIAASALHLAHLIRWVAGLWHETQESRLRRRYLHLLGPSLPLPAGWLSTLKQAYATTNSGVVKA